MRISLKIIEMLRKIFELIFIEATVDLILFLYQFKFFYFIVSSFH